MLCMKVKLFILLCFLFVLGNQAVVAQERTVEPEVGEPAVLRMVYTFTQQAVKDRESVYITDTMALEVGMNGSVYYDWNKNRRDSLAAVRFTEPVNHKITVSVDENALQSRLEAQKQVYDVLDAGRGQSYRIYKKRDKEEIITIDNGPLEGFDTKTYFQLTENIPPQAWKMSGDTSTVLNYLCQKAAATFRGRTYVAWFTLDIPINDGPWKFYGLPGLILKVQDLENKFCFLAIGLQKAGGESITMPTDRKRVSCNLKELSDFKKNERRYISVGFVENGGVVYYRTKNPVTYFSLERGD